MKPYQTAYCYISGILIVLATPPIGLWPLAFIAFVPFFRGLEKEFCTVQRLSFGNVFQKGFIVGLFFSTSLFFWVVHVNLWATLSIIALFSCLFGFFAQGLLFGLKSRYKGSVICLWASVLWVSIEILSSELILQLPSCAIGYTLWKVPALIQIADITGVFGISFWIMAINLLAARLLIDGLNNTIVWTAVTVCLTILIIAYGHWHPAFNFNTAPGRSLEISLVHTSVKSEEKRDPVAKKHLFTELINLTQRSYYASQKEPVDLYVWPETSVPLFLRTVKEKKVVEQLLHTARSTQADILIGARAITMDQSGAIEGFNSAFLVPPRGYIAQEYHKIILAPFIEMIPLSPFFPASGVRRTGFTHIKAGTEFGLMTTSKGAKFAVSICWEAFFPDFIRRLAASGGDFLVNISNDEAAFGEMESAYSLPLAHAVFRSVENRRYLVRCSNWGRSMIISPRGNIIKETAWGTAGVLRGNVDSISRQTFFTQHGFILAKGLFFFSLLWALGTVLLRKQKLK